MKPLFSIVIPSFNCLGYLKMALESIFAQDAQDAEVIVVDGGSSDGTRGFLEEVQSRLSWWCSEPDNGQSHALNKGFARAKGEYFTWLNADDMLLPSALDAVRKRIASKGAQWIAANQIYIDCDNRVIRCTRGNKWHDFLYKRDLPQVYGPSSFFTRRLFVSSGGFDESLRYCMDRDLWIKFARLGARFDRLDRYCWGFRVHDGSKTQSKTRDAAELERQRTEIVAMYARYGISPYSLRSRLSRFLRMLDGTYAKSAFDTIRLRGSRV